MSQRVRIIFWVLFLLIGMQWVGDPIEVRLRSDWNSTADWNDRDDTDLDHAHHHGVVEQRHAVLLTPAMPDTGFALLEWLPFPSDPGKHQSPVLSSWIPRAPPAL